MNPKVYLFPNPLESKHYFHGVSLEDYQELEQQVKNQKYTIEFYESEMCRHEQAGSIFQPDGKYHKEANLQLGSSYVVEGIKWLTMSMEGYKQKWADQIDASNILRNILCRVEGELEEIKNEAVEKSEIVRGEIEAMKAYCAQTTEEKDKALELRDYWHKSYMNCRNIFYDKIEQAKEKLDELIKQESSCMKQNA